MTDEESRPVRRRVTLTGISSRAWEHPADRGALTALRELRGFDELVKAFFGMWNERGFRLAVLAGAIRVDHRQYPRVYQRFTEAATTLDVAELPELFVHPGPGDQRPGDRPGQAVHRDHHGGGGEARRRRAAGHARPRARPRAQRARRLQDDHDDPHPVGASTWPGCRSARSRCGRSSRRCSSGGARPSCPPTGPACSPGRTRPPSTRLLMKLAGGGDLSQIDTAAFLEQAAEYESGGDLRDSIHKLGMTVWNTHPVPVARAADLRKWIDSGEYARILGGDYPRRDSDGDASVSRGREGRRGLVPGNLRQLAGPAGRPAPQGSVAAPPTWPGRPRAAPAPGRATRAGATARRVTPNS